MSETPHRWYVVRYNSKEDATQEIDYDFGEKVQESVFFPTEQAAHAIQSLMRPGVTFTLADGRKQTIYEADGVSFDIGPAHVEVCKAAAKELRRNDLAVPARVFGMVVRLQNDTDPTDLNERTGAHEVFLLWSSIDFGDIRVKINLTPPEYLEAVRAHAAGRPVSISGVLSKYGRQWALQEPREFAVSEQRELPL